MTQENKELLLKDLCARLPYNTKFRYEYKDSFGRTAYSTSIITGIRFPNYVEHCLFTGTDYLHIEKDVVKPYLFPLSSITIEQEKELSKLGVSYGEYALHDDIRGLGIMVDEAYIFFEFCYKHHIDFLGLIEMGSAIDATGLNIY